ncbi:MAG: adenylate/guanylate cyclase domain-containing protein, partial [Chloroflexota bacterium]|nr:adenylate/guanylate cyclase domain-containing protein [Chloroflexota bacterium]
DPLQAGQAALARHAWPEAFEQLSRADRESQLSGADLESLSLAAFFAAHGDVDLATKERAFKAYEVEKNDIRAAFVAIQVARAYAYAGKYSIASGWQRRAEQLIGTEGDTYVHGHLALIESEIAGYTGNVDLAFSLAERAVAIGRGAADADLTAYALTNLGGLKIASGAPLDGFALMEEASFAAVNDELSPFISGMTACRLIGACRDLTDYRRATEWIEATERYCDRQSLSGFPGVCRVHRAEVTAVGGAWDKAEQDLERATIELGAYNATPPQADGFYAMGDIRRLRGDFEGAEAALREAHARGKSPQPALALVRLGEGKIKAAASAINAAVADQTWDRWARARLLPAQVEIAIAAGDLGRARTAAEELAGIVVGYPSPALEAGRRVALGRVLLAEGDAAGAAPELRAGIKSWREVGAPYEIARARAVLSRALRATEDEDDADLELHAALDEFQRLGARVDAEAAEREIRAAEDRRTGPVSTKKTFMFTDIVGSTNLAEALGDQAWERLLRWHDDALRKLVAGGGGEIVNSTGDGFFAAFESARSGVACAISIQRALLEHRTSTGFALPVRIGLHTAEANRRGTDYSGKGVHVAARVAALAGGGEILATAATLAEAGDVSASEPRSAPVKGVTVPLSVATISWN